MVGWTANAFCGMAIGTLMLFENWITYEEALEFVSARKA